MSFFGILGILLLGSLAGVSRGFSQSGLLADTIWTGFLKGSTKEVAHYQGDVKRSYVTGATANQIPAEIWFPSNTNFCVIFNNLFSRASAADGRDGIMVHDAHLYDIVVGVNPCPTNPMLSYWQGTGTVDLAKKRLIGTSQTEEETSSGLNLVATYTYKKTGNQETLTVKGTAVLPIQTLDFYGDGWKLNPGVVTFAGTFTKSTKQVSIEAPKQGIEGF